MTTTSISLVSLTPTRGHWAAAAAWLHVLSCTLVLRRPSPILKVFACVDIKLGQSRPINTLTLTLSRYDLSIWDVTAQGWKKPEGKITFSVGASSRDFRLKGSIPV